MGTAATPQTTDRTFAAITVGGGALAAAGSFMPWLTATVSFLGTTISRSGLDGGGDGVITLIVGVVVAAVGVARLTTVLPSWVARTPIVLGALLAAIAVMDLSSVADRAAANSSPLLIVSTGAGLYVILVGALAAVFGGCVVTRGRGGA